MRQSLGVALVLCSAVSQAGAQPPPKAVVTGLTNPESVAVNTQGQVFVSVIGERDRDGDGAVLKIEQGKIVPFASGLNDPKGLVAHQQWLFVADKNRVWRIDGEGKAAVFAPASAFPTSPLFLNDLAVDVETGTLYVSDSGNRQGEGGAVYRISPKGVVSLVLDKKRFPNLHTPNGLLLDGASHLLLADSGTGTLYRIKLADSSVEKLTEGLGAADGLAWDQFGRLFVSDWRGGRVFVIARPGAKPVLLTQGLTNAADIAVEAATKRLLIPDTGGGTVVAAAITVPGAEVNEEPLPLKTSVAFPDLQWTGWKGESEDGRVHTLRPIVLMHAGDGSNRVFVATQHGVIHVFPNDQNATRTTVFLDIQDRVSYKDETNEEGFLGLTFHPRFKENGYFYVFYTSKSERLTNIVSRLQVRKDDPNQADPASEVEILRFKKPYWNHDGEPSSSAGTASSTSRTEMAAPVTTPTRTVRISGPCSARSSASTLTTAKAARTTRSPKTIPSSAVPTPVPRSGLMASATSGAWPSTGRPAGSGRVRSARTSGRKSTSSPREATTAGTSVSRCIPSESRASAPGPS